MDARDIVRGIWRRKYMVLAFTVIAAAGGIGFVATADREYTARAQVLLENLETPFDRTQPNDADRRQFDESEIASQVQVLRSRDLARRVVNDLRLTERPEFDPLARGLSKPAEWMIALGLKPDPRLQTPEQRAMMKLESDIKVYQVATSRVIEIEGASSNPQTAAEIANALAEVFVVSTREAQSDSTVRSRQWLAEQIETLRKKVVDSEVAVEKFRVEAGLIQGPTTMLSTQELAELNTQIILAEAARSEAQAKATAIRELVTRTGAVETSSAVLASPLIQRLREQQIALQRTQAELSSTYLSNHPRILAVRRELEDLNRQVRAEALKVVEGLEQEAKVAASREEALRARLNSLKSRAGENSADQVKLRALEREAAANRTLLESFLSRFGDASARQEVLAQPGTARIIARADPPSEPSFPKSVPIILLATLAGFTIGLGLAFMAEVMKAGGRMPEAARTPHPATEPEQAERAPELPVAPVPVEPSLPTPAAAMLTEEPRLESARTLERREPKPVPQAQASMPYLCTLPRPSAGGEGRAAVAAGDLEGAFAIALKPLVSWCMSLRRTLGVRRIALVAGEDAGPDGTAAVVMLARSLAAEDLRVLLLDVAHDGARVADMAGMDQRPGLRELLSGKAKFSDVIFKDEAGSAHLLGAGLASNGTLEEVTASMRMDKVLDALDHAYDLVLVHVDEPLAKAGERRVIAKCHAAVVFASGWQPFSVASLLSDLAAMGLSALQVVRFEDRSAATMPRLPQKVAVNA